MTKQASHCKYMKSRPGRARQHGQGLVEYLLIVALIAIATITTVTYFGDTLRSQFAGVSKEVSGQSGVEMRDQAVIDADNAADEGVRQRAGMSDYMNRVHGGDGGNNGLGDDQKG